MANTTFVDLRPRTRVGFGVFFTLCIAVGSYTAGYAHCYFTQDIAKLMKPECIVWK